VDVVYLDFSKAFNIFSYSLLLEKLIHYSDTSEGRANPAEDVDRLEERAKNNLMKFKKNKCKVLHLRKQNPGVQHRLGSTWLGSSCVERDLEVLVHSKLNMSEQCAAAAKQANTLLGCINKRITSRDKEVIIPLYSECLSVHIWNTMFIFGPAMQKRCGQAGEGPEQGHKDDQRTGNSAT